MMRYLYILCLGLLPLLQYAQGTVVLYDGNFVGGAKALYGDWNIKGNDVIWNDKISSIYIPEGYEVQVFEHHDFRGESRKFSSGSVSLKFDEKEWDDRISAIRITKRPAGYKMHYSCHFLQGAQWKRMDDIVLASNGIMYYGVSPIQHPDVTESSVSWSKETGNLFSGDLIIEGQTLHGTIDHPAVGKIKVKGNLNEVVQNTDPPFMARKENAVVPQPAAPIVKKPAPKPVEKTVAPPQPQQAPVVQQAPAPPPVRGYVKLYLTDNFTGESKIIRGNWDPKEFNERYKWGNNINSIKVTEGWAIQVFRYSGYGGTPLELTDSWSAKDNPDWRDDISSIRIVSKQDPVYAGRHRHDDNARPRYSRGYVKIYLKDDFTGESKVISSDWNPNKYPESYKWGNKVNSIKIPEGWSIRAYRFSDYGGSFIELSDDWSAKDNPDWRNEIGSIKIVHKPQ